MDRAGPSGPGRSRRTRQSPLSSPLLAVGLALVVVGLVGAILVVPGLLPTSSASPSVRCLGGQSAGPCSQSAATSSPAPSPTGTGLPTFIRPTPTPVPTFTSYTVRAGDSLITIARRFQTTARSIAWWNRGTYPSLDPQSANYAPNNIQLGWVLVLIPGVKVDDANPPTPSPGPPTPSPGPPSSTPGASASA